MQQPYFAEDTVLLRTPTPYHAALSGTPRSLRANSYSQLAVGVAGLTVWLRGRSCAYVYCRLISVAGDNGGTAAAVAQQLHLDPKHVHYELLPQDKLKLVKCYTRGCPLIPRNHTSDRGTGPAAAPAQGSSANPAHHVVVVIDGVTTEEQTRGRSKSAIVAHVGEVLCCSGGAAFDTHELSESLYGHLW